MRHIQLFVKLISGNEYTFNGKNIKSAVHTFRFSSKAVILVVRHYLSRICRTRRDFWEDSMKIVPSIFHVAFYLIICVKCTYSYSLNDTHLLHNSLLIRNNYNKNIRGTADQRMPVLVYAKFFLRSIESFDDVAGTFSVIGYFLVRWRDIRLVWSRSHHHGILSTMLPQSQVWSPYIVVDNSMGGLSQIGNGAGFVWIQNDGFVVLETVSQVFKSSCSADVTNFPFDKQVIQVWMVYVICSGVCYIIFLICIWKHYNILYYWASLARNYLYHFYHTLTKGYKVK